MTEGEVNPKDVNQYLSQQMGAIFQKDFVEYGKIHSINSRFDPDWKTTGGIQKAFDYIKDYIQRFPINRLEGPKMIELENRSPALTFSVPPTESSEDYTILFYSHVDKIPFGEGWKYDPENPKSVDKHFYARGAANGGYSIFSIVHLILALQQQELSSEKPEGIKLPRFVALLDSSKENESVDLEAIAMELEYKPNLIICMESERFNSGIFNVFTSMRGLIEFDLTIQTVVRDLHSGKFGGLAPDCHTIINELISRIEKVDLENNTVSIPHLDVEMTEEQIAEAEELKAKLGEDFYSCIPIDNNSMILGKNFNEIFFAQTYKGCLNVHKQYTIPTVAEAAPTFHKSVTVRLTFRVPPSLDVETCYNTICDELKNDVPYNASITIDNEKLVQGRIFPYDPRMKNEFENARKNLYSQNSVSNFNGSGDTMFYVDALLKVFPESDILVAGPSIANNSFTRVVNENIDMVSFLNYTAIMAVFSAYFKKYSS